MIRFCNGEVYTVVLDECVTENIVLLFENMGQNILIQVIDENNKFVGMVSYSDYQSERIIDNCSVKLDAKIFKNARENFSHYDKEYLPVLNEDNELECFCYDDDLDSEYSNCALILTDADIARRVFEEYTGVNVWGFNEWAYRLVQALQNANITYCTYGDLWNRCNLGNNKGEVEERCYDFRSEGHQGLELDQLGLWRNELPLWEYSKIKRKIQKLDEENRIFRSSMCSATEVHERIYDAIIKRTPFCVSRLGHTEAQIACCKENGFYDKLWLDWLYTTSGFFSGCGKQIVLSEVDDYVERTRAGIRNTDVNIVMTPMVTGYLVNKYADKNVMNAHMEDVGVLNSASEKLWTEALKGKRVLVVSSISETVEAQYLIRDKLHKREILPKFDLITLQAYETQLGNTMGFENWEAAYQSLLEKVRRIKFDVALISAGAYGYPLASDIKNMGKVAVELCSSLQPLFGIKIKRHDIVYEINQHWNEFWRYPMESGPARKDVIEYGCYWR